MTDRFQTLADIRIAALNAAVEKLSKNAVTDEHVVITANTFEYYIQNGYKKERFL